jgi:hypothetical protein
MYPYHPLYRMMPAEMGKYQKQITNFKDKGYIKESQSLFTVLRLFVPKIYLDDFRNKL